MRGAGGDGKRKEKTKNGIASPPSGVFGNKLNDLAKSAIEKCMLFATEKVQRGCCLWGA